MAPGLSAADDGAMRVPAGRRVLELRALAAVLFAAVVAGAIVADDPRQAVVVLFVLPVALLAISDGQRGGLAGAVTATALTVVWVLVDDIALAPLGWVSRLTSFWLLALMVGRYEDLARRQELRVLNERHAHELQDRVVQRLVLARYRLRADGAPAEAQDSVEVALEEAKAIISARLGGIEPGSLRLRGAPRPPAP